MIVSDKEALGRLSSPNNLMNRLRTSSSPRSQAMNLFIPSSRPAPFQPTNPFTNTATNHQSDSPPTELASNPTVLTPEVVQGISSDDILDNSDAKIKLSLAHNKALDVMVRMLDVVGNKIDDVRPASMGSILSALTKTVDNIRRERIKLNEDNKGKNVHFHFYEPARNKIEDYDSLDV